MYTLVVLGENQMKNKVILKIRAGSHLYGLNTPTSDEDFIGVYLSTPEELLGLNHSEIIDESVVNKDETGKNTQDAVDCKYYELRKFCQLCLNANPTILELLYAPDENIVEIDKFGKLLMQSRNLFLSTKIKHSFVGYAHSQMHKSQVKTENLQGLKKALKYFETLDEVDRNKMLYDFFKIGKSTHLERSCDNIGLTIDKNFPSYVIIGDLKLNNQKIKSVIEKIQLRVSNATNRANSMLKHGCDPKFISHTLRLLDEGEELLTTGFLELPLKNRDYLLKIKKAELDFGEVLKEADERIKNLEVMKDEDTVLTKKPDSKAVDRLVYSIYRDYLIDVLDM